MRLDVASGSWDNLIEALTDSWDQPDVGDGIGDMMMKVLALFACGAVLLGASVAHAQTFGDGDFNSPSGGPSYTEYAGNQSFGPWQVSGDSVDLIGGYWQDPNGTAGSVDLNGVGPGAISQTFSTIAGTTYDVSFYLAGNPDSGESPDPAMKTGSVVADAGAETFSFTNTGAQTRTDMQYAPESFSFTADGATSTLTFAGTNDGPYGAVIGDIVVSAAPEPGLWVLMIAGVGLMGAMLRFSRRRLAGLSPAA